MARPWFYIVIAVAVSIIALSALWAAWTYSSSACTVSANERIELLKSLDTDMPSSCYLRGALSVDVSSQD